MGREINTTFLIHNEEIQSIFETLGSNENDLSYSLGYVLSKTPSLLKSIINKVYSKKLKFKDVIIKLQESGDDGGFTDIEITIDNEYFFVIEAKKGWNLPQNQQIKRYLKRFRGYKISKRLFIVLSDCTVDFFKENSPDSLYGIPIRSITWHDVIKSINMIYPKASNKEKYLLKELKEYLKKVVTMENNDSNWVYVVSLSNSIPKWSSISWIDIVNKKGNYFYPFAPNWPKLPPNYIAFRYGGKLQTIHHVDSYEVTTELHKHIPEIKKGAKKHPLYILKLGAAFEPRKELPNGNIWSNGRVWCMLDTLFTSKTIKEACEISRKRKK